MQLPPPRTAGRYRIALVCLGNICRSPTAHVVLEQRLAEAGLADRVEVASSGTGRFPPRATTRRATARGSGTRRGPRRTTWCS